MHAFAVCFASKTKHPLSGAATISFGMQHKQSYRAAKMGANHGEPGVCVCACVCECIPVLSGALLSSAYSNTSVLCIASRLANVRGVRKWSTPSRQ